VVCLLLCCVQWLSQAREEAGKAFGGEHVIARSQDLSNAQMPNVWLVDVELSILENHHPPQILEGTA